MNRIAIKIAVMEAEIALHRLKPILDEVIAESEYVELDEAWRDYCAAFSHIQQGLRAVGAL